MTLWKIIIIIIITKVIHVSAKSSTFHCKRFQRILTIYTLIEPTIGSTLINTKLKPQNGPYEVAIFLPFLFFFFFSFSLSLSLSPTSTTHSIYMHIQISWRVSSCMRFGDSHMTQNKDQISTHICIYPIVNASSIKDSRSMLWNEGKVHGFSHAFTCITCMNLISSSLYLISSSKISDKDLPQKDIFTQKNHLVSMCQAWCVCFVNLFDCLSNCC